MPCSSEHKGKRRRVMDLSGYCRRDMLEVSQLAARRVVFNFPLDVVVEILTRLPARSLLRFRSVCKLWHSLTQEQHFISRHSQNRRDKTSLNIITLSWMPWIGEFSLHYFVEGCHKFDLRTLRTDKTDFVFCLSNSCNGLICVFGRRTTCVVNPSIRELVTLPDPHRAYEVNVALGYVISTGKYKVVRLFCHQGMRVGCEIFTLGSHSWRVIEDAPFPISFFGTPVFFNETIYWNTDSLIEPLGPEIAISFDIKNETFDIVMHPEGCSRPRASTVSELGGCLCILDSKTEWHKTLRILKDSRNHEWINHSINLELMEDLSLCSATQMRSVAIRDGKILLSDSIGRFDYYDPKSGSFDTPVYLTYGRAAPYVESLISPSAIQEKIMGRLPAWAVPKWESWRQWGNSNGRGMGFVATVSGWNWDDEWDQRGLPQSAWPKSVP